MQTLNSVEQLTGLIATLEHQNTVKKDMVANSKSHILFIEGKLQIIDGEGLETYYTPTKHFHSQMAEKLNIPGGYYNRMLSESVSLLDTNVNTWLGRDSKNYLIRTFEDAAKAYEARAFLSDSYSIIDNYQVLIETLEAIKESGVHIEVEGAELSDTKMYLKVVCPEVEISAGEMLKDYRVKKNVGDGVISGFTMQNSEIGAGSFLIMPRAKILTCNNGATMVTDQLKKIHLGSKMDELGFNKNERVMRANLRLVKEQINHAVKIFLSKEYLQKLVNVYSKLGEPKIEAPVDKVIHVVGKNYGISEERKANILKYFVEGGDTRRIGLANAMTLECQGLQDVDLKNETETVAFEVLQNFAKFEAAASKLKVSAN